MPVAETQPAARRPVDGAALARIGRRLAAAREVPWLHAEVARRMAERLPVIRHVPEQVLEWGAAAGGGSAELARAYPRARRLHVERAEDLQQALSGAARSRSWWQRLRGASAPEAVDEAGVAPGAAGLVWANMLLHGRADPPAVLRAWQRALAADGFLMFSTLGPGTLEGLRELHARHGWGVPMAALVDMHDLGDMLVEAGFADPVMDQETLTLTWPDARAALAELRTLGGNAHPARFAGLRTPRWLARLQAAMAHELAQGAAPQGAADGRIALTFEVVYGHAFKAPPRLRVAGETVISPEDLRRMARAGRQPSSSRGGGAETPPPASIRIRGA